MNFQTSSERIEEALEEAEQWRIDKTTQVQAPAYLNSDFQSYTEESEEVKNMNELKLRVRNGFLDEISSSSSKQSAGGEDVEANEELMHIVEVVTGEESEGEPFAHRVLTPSNNLLNLNSPQPKSVMKRL